jgi:hypothetical protein
MTTTTPSVPLPPGFTLMFPDDDWAFPRCLTKDQYVFDGRLHISADAWMRGDGTICRDHVGEQPGIYLGWKGTDTNIRLTADGAREAASALLAMATALDGLEADGCARS